MAPPLSSAQLREFLYWYGKMLKKKKNTMREDVEDVYRAFNGEPEEEAGLQEKKAVTKEEFAAMLKKEYDLDVDVEAVFNSFGKDLKMADFESLLIADPESARTPR